MLLVSHADRMHAWLQAARHIGLAKLGWTAARILG